MSSTALPRISILTTVVLAAHAATVVAAAPTAAEAPAPAAPAAAAPATSPLGAPAANVPADYTTIVLNTRVARPADAVWKKVGGFCDISAWLKLTCVYTSGSGDLGSVRRLADRIDEVMVGKTARSYTYTQPTTKILYHGTLAVEPDGADHSKIIYSLFYDQSQLASDQAKAADRAQRTRIFNAALDSMKKLAESP